jgi:SAM-dependent methyltransferase
VNDGCPICGSHELVEFSGRPRARCTGCDALERHRKLARVLGLLWEAAGHGDGGERGEGEGRGGGDRHGAGRKALEVGPLNPRVFGQLLRDRGWHYTAIDQSRRGNPHDPRNTDFVDMEVDLCALDPFASDSLQLVLAQHVIEEIADYRQAFAEIARVLGPGGQALLEIPFSPARSRSESQPPGAYGNVWRFGADLPEHAREYFMEVDVLSYREGAFRGQLFICRVPS